MKTSQGVIDLLKTLGSGTQLVIRPLGAVPSRRAEHGPQQCCPGKGLAQAPYPAACGPSPIALHHRRVPAVSPQAVAAPCPVSSQSRRGCAVHGATRSSPLAPCRPAAQPHACRGDVAPGAPLSPGAAAGIFYVPASCMFWRKLSISLPDGRVTG